MDSTMNQSGLSSLPNILLVLIMSYLPFKELVKTSVLSKRWKHLYRETPYVSFIESDFVKPTDDEETKKNARASFIAFMVKWVLTSSTILIESFEICLSTPTGFETEIVNSLIKFAVTKQVINLILDFSDVSWITSNQPRSVFTLPECVYGLETLESLKLIACGFDVTRLTQTEGVKSFCFGWMSLGNIEGLLERCPLLESLTIQNCSNVGLEMITSFNNAIRVLTFENCVFATEYSMLELSNIEVFKYVGELHHFQFLDMNYNMKEAELDFGGVTEYDDGTGSLLCTLLYDLKFAKMLTVCSFLIQLVKDGDDPMKLSAPMETRHLVVKTNLQPCEFVGIRLMINSCPELETLTFVLVPPMVVSSTSLGFDPDTYWTRRVTYECLKRTLKVVEVMHFTGGLRECQVLQYLLQYGRVLEKVDLYLSSEIDDSQKISARAAATMIQGPGLKKASSGVTIVLHNC